MASTFHNSHMFTPFPIDLNEDDQHQQLLFSPLKSPAEAASSSSNNSLNSYPLFIHPPQQHGGFYHPEEGNIYVWHGGSCDTPPKMKSETVDDGLKLSMCQKEENQSENNSSGPVKWMSSKMRVVRKMMSPDQVLTGSPEPSPQKFNQDQTITNNNNNNNNIIRVCSDCNTTKTPLWRSGPRGPKSLCNACGIRQRKARRAMAAAAAAAAAAASTNGNGSAQIYNADTSTVKICTNKVANNKDKKGNNNNNNSHLPLKKRCKFTGQGRGGKKFGFEDLTIILNKNSAFHERVFPQDEKEAAILLMALSYGLVHG